jgi:glycosyltransferase involved in cell wall biosynthesis
VDGTAAERIAISEEPVIRAIEKQGGAFSIPRVSLVIPTLNEAQNLPGLLSRIPGWVSETIIVDGRSSDNTLEVARTLMPDVRIVLEDKPGKGAAMRAGFNAATGDIIAMIDADCSMDPGELILFVAALISGADFAKGSRFVQGGGTTDMSLVRMFGNWGLTNIVRLIYGVGFSDLCYGYNAFWARHLPLLNIDCDGFEIETALNISAAKSGLRIIEVPSWEALRLHGKSNLRPLADGLRVLLTILQEITRKARPPGGSRLRLAPVEPSRPESPISMTVG